MSVSGSSSMTNDFLEKKGFGFLHAFASEEKRDDECMLASAQNKDEENGSWISACIRIRGKTNCQSSLKMFVL